MCDIRYFRRAFLDYRAAENLLKVPENDEAYMNAVAYHLQAVEKTLKAFLECAGVTVPNAHDIDKLARMTKNNGSAAVLTEWIGEKTDMLTRWETDTRYDMDYCVEEEKVRAGLEEVGRFLELNGLKETLREELCAPEAKERLAECFPRAYRPESDFESQEGTFPDACIATNFSLNENGDIM